jgi:hypothetical protein
VSVSADQLAETAADQPLYAVTRAQETELPQRLKLAYIEAALDYRVAAVEAQQSGGSSRRDVLIELPAAVSQADALKRAEVYVEPPKAAVFKPAPYVAVEPITTSYEAGDEKPKRGYKRRDMQAE